MESVSLQTCEKEIRLVEINILVKLSHKTSSTNTVSLGSHVKPLHFLGGNSTENKAGNS